MWRRSASSSVSSMRTIGSSLDSHNLRAGVVTTGAGPCQSKSRRRRCGIVGAAPGPSAGPTEPPMSTPRAFLDVLGAADLAPALERTLRMLAREPLAVLPRVGNLDGAVVARGLYRERLAAGPWFPLLQ